MQRSDISSINKLFVESTQKQYFVYYIEWDHDHHTRGYFAARSEIKSGSSIDNVAVELIIKKLERDEQYDKARAITTFPLKVYKAKDATGVLLTRESESDVILVSSEQMDEEDISGIYDMTNYKQIDYKQLVDNHKYRVSALAGSNDEAGLGDVLDVL